MPRASIANADSAFESIWARYIEWVGHARRLGLFFDVRAEKRFSAPDNFQISQRLAQGEPSQTETQTKKGLRKRQGSYAQLESKRRRVGDSNSI